MLYCNADANQSVDRAKVFLSRLGSTEITGFKQVSRVGSRIIATAFSSLILLTNHQSEEILIRSVCEVRRLG